MSKDTVALMAIINAGMMGSRSDLKFVKLPKLNSNRKLKRLKGKRWHALDFTEVPHDLMVKLVRRYQLDLQMYNYGLNIKTRELLCGKGMSHTPHCC